MAPLVYNATIWTDLRSGLRMSDISKVDRIKLDLGRRNIAWKSAVPPFWRILWRLGVVLPAPMFLGFFANFFGAWLSSWAFCIAGVYVLPWSHPESILWTLLSWGAGTMVFGFLEARRVRCNALAQGVPRWHDYR